MGNRYSYFTDREIKRVCDNLNHHQLVRGKLNYLKNYLLKHYEKLYFKETDQIVKILINIKDLPSQNSRFNALILMIPHIKREDRSKFNSTALLEPIIYNRYDAIQALESHNMKPIAINQTNQNLSKIRSASISTIGSGEDHQACIYCLQYKRRVIFDQCGHLALCSQCAIQKTFKHCLICQEPNSGLKLVYL